MAGTSAQGLQQQIEDAGIWGAHPMEASAFLVVVPVRIGDLFDATVTRALWNEAAHELNLQALLMLMLCNHVA